LRLYVAVILHLLEQPTQAANEAGNELTARTLTLSADAKRAWVAFHDQIEAAMASGGALDGLRDVAGKAAENAAHRRRPDGCRNPGCGNRRCGGDDELLRPDVVVRRRSATAFRSTSIAAGNAQRGQMLDWLRAGSAPEISLREIMRNGPNAARGKPEAEAALAKLEDHGWVVRHGHGRGARWTLVRESTP
jgi:Protein of unknown function (DUF3987)